MKIDMAIRNHKNVEFFKCNRCGKLKYKIDEKQTTYESGSMTRKTDITEKTRTTKIIDEKYSKYNMAAKTICPVCKNPKMKCSCKKQRSVSVSTIGIRRSENAGNIDLTPKVKINLNPEKIRKAVEEQRRIAEEEEKRKKERKSIRTEENIRSYSKEERYNYNKTTETNIREEDLCHCGDENCAHNQEIVKKRKQEEELKNRREEELKRAKLIEEQRLKRVEEERIKKIKMEEERDRGDASGGSAES